MKLNINSVSARLYRWFYATAQMPKSLCPYFWKLVLMWVFIVPYTILSFPGIAIKDSKIISTGERASMGFIVWIITFLVICMLSCASLFFVSLPEDSNSLFFNMIGVGFMCWLIVIIFGAIELFKWIRDKGENRNVKYDEHGYRILKPKQPSIITEFIKAKYNKYCPKIDWKYNND